MRLFVVRFFTLISLALATTSLAASAADRDKVAAFVDVIGFDVALESLELSAFNAPAMLGIDPGSLGPAWQASVSRTFDKDKLVAEAIDILAATLSDDMLNHGADFYASELGQRIVEAENISHLDESPDQTAQGEALVAGFLEAGSPRPDMFRAMQDAIGGAESSVNAWIELQIRFVTAADVAGVLDLKVRPGVLRGELEARTPQMLKEIEASALASSAWTYRIFSDEEVNAYVRALEAPKMQLVYQLLSATQFELQAARYEVLAQRLLDIYSGQEL